MSGNMHDVKEDSLFIAVVVCCPAQAACVVFTEQGAHLLEDEPDKLRVDVGCAGEFLQNFV